MNKIGNSIGRRIKGLRGASDIKQEVFAKNLRVSKSCLSLYENGKREITFNTFVEILKVFEKYGKADVVLELLEDIKNEVLFGSDINLNERIGFEMNELKNKVVEFENRGFSKVEGVNVVSEIFFPQIFSREIDYYVKNFKDIYGNDIGVYFANNDLGQMIGIFENLKVKRYMSKEDFKYELDKEDDGRAKYGENIPNEELVQLDATIIFSEELESLDLLDDVFDLQTRALIEDEFKQFANLFK